MSICNSSNKNSNYRQILESTAKTLMKGFELNILLKDCYNPEIFHDKTTGSTCLLFKGDEEDMILLEDYLKHKDEL